MCLLYSQSRICNYFHLWYNMLYENDNHIAIFSTIFFFKVFIFTKLFFLQYHMKISYLLQPVFWFQEFTWIEHLRIDPDALKCCTLSLCMLNMLKQMEVRSYAFDCYAWTFIEKVVKYVFSTHSQVYAIISIFDTICFIKMTTV